MIKNMCNWETNKDITKILGPKKNDNSNIINIDFKFVSFLSMNKSNYSK